MPDAKVNRRGFLGLCGAVAAGGMLAYTGRGLHAAEVFPVTKTDAQWKQQLTPAQYNVLREQGTERPQSSSLDHFYEKGRYDCVACDQHLFASDTKFDSGTGWPSFWQPLPGAVGTTTDTSMFMARVEIHCARCGGHLGHVFDDGPPPTGKRYCMNGVALKFVPV